jgi:hypothetical protein
MTPIIARPTVALWRTGLRFPPSALVAIIELLQPLRARYPKFYLTKGVGHVCGRGRIVYDADANERSRSTKIRYPLTDLAKRFDVAVWLSIAPDKVHGWCVWNYCGHRQCRFLAIHWKKGHQIEGLLESPWLTFPRLLPDLVLMRVGRHVDFRCQPSASLGRV